MNRRIASLACALLVLQTALPNRAGAYAPSADEQYRAAISACGSLTNARIAEENATGLLGPEPKGDNALRDLIAHDDGYLRAAIQDMANFVGQLNGNPQADALPISRVTRRQAAESTCFAETLLRVRQGGSVGAAPSAPSGPPPAPPVDPAVDPAITRALSSTAAASRDALERALAPEPGPLGLQAAPASAFQRPTPASNPREPVVNVRYLGLMCMKVRNRPWEINSDQNWNSEFTLENECGFPVLLRVDTGERDEGEDTFHSYTSNGGLVAMGVPNWQWPDDKPLPFSWTPAWRRGEGAEWRSYTSPKLYLVSTSVERRYIDVFIYACPLNDEATGRRNILWVEQQRLMDPGNRTCAPVPPTN
ncbi:MAG: hypothetical protein K1X35_09530 [Caulobacteraceae bacterium]|nr:hypothetical protein [Caulobacteraceae bacterium]